MWVRGLKLYAVRNNSRRTVSHPMWVRGLKHNVITFDEVNSVAPYVGAWIETLSGGLCSSGQPVAPYVGAWIET